MVTYGLYVDFKCTYVKVISKICKLEGKLDYFTPYSRKRDVTFLRCFLLFLSNTNQGIPTGQFIFFVCIFKWVRATVSLTARKSVWANCTSPSYPGPVQFRTSSFWWHVCKSSFYGSLYICRPSFVYYRQVQKSDRINSDRQSGSGQLRSTRTVSDNAKKHKIKVVLWRKSHLSDQSHFKTYCKKSSLHKKKNAVYYFEISLFVSETFEFLKYAN